MLMKVPPKVLTGDGDDDNDDSWMPSDAEWASLDDPTAPYELHGLVRMHRNGMGTPKIIDVFQLDPGALIDQMQEGYDQESDAEYRGVPVHDAGIKAGTV